MELLSFSYLFLEAIFLSMTIAGFILSWSLTISGVILLFFYPLVYEPLLTIFFRLKFKAKSADKRQLHNQELFTKTNAFLYHETYNFDILGFKEISGLDLERSRNVLDQLIRKNPERGFAFVFNQNEPDYSEIYSFSSVKQMILLNYTFYLCYVFERPLLLPACILRLMLLRKYLHQVQGTLNGVSMAATKGVSINLGGGFHHASTFSASGLSPYADVSMAIQHLWHFHPHLKTIMIIDLDARQGNGTANDKTYLLQLKPKEEGDNQNLVKRRLFIVDAFNSDLSFPRDDKALALVDISIPLKANETDDIYLSKISQNLEESKFRCRPDFIIYLAGTDVLRGDSVGKMRLSPQCIAKRDKIVMDLAKSANTPILMLLGGGLQKENAVVISESLLLLAKEHEQLNFGKSRIG